MHGNTSDVAAMLVSFMYRVNKMRWKRPKDR